MAETIVRHPALAGRFSGPHTLSLPGRLTLCGLPETLDALAALVTAHDTLTGAAP
ncbi:ferrichrome ABC transporter [Gluconobacter morbifer G707]|uniref:Ferrichrome ABC transporter n=1 Tax=Gluconobacter morbifer G707 TaxID=1088869 RepID=G6XJL6_9PROT|nr:ferrichrome ABC transporter [Gluconobacter morbifer G707]